MSDVRVVALHKEERRAVRALLLEAVKDGKDEDGMLQGVAEMLLKTTLRGGELEALRDA